MEADSVHTLHTLPQFQRSKCKDGTCLTATSAALEPPFFSSSSCSSPPSWSCGYQRAYVDGKQTTGRLNYANGTSTLPHPQSGLAGTLLAKDPWVVGELATSLALTNKHVEFYYCTNTVAQYCGVINEASPIDNAGIFNIPARLQGPSRINFVDISELALNLVDLSTFITHDTTVQGLAWWIQQQGP
jgi:hypothetical protein